MKLAEAIKQQRFKSEEEKSIVNILYTAYWINDIHNKILEPYGISVQQFNILRILRGRHPSAATVNLLKERMLDKNSGVSRLVEKLRRKGLLIREPNEIDRRQVDIMITEKGLEMLTELDEKMNDLIDLPKCFTREELNQLNNMLDKLREQRPLYPVPAK